MKRCNLRACRLLILCVVLLVTSHPAAAQDVYPGKSWEVTGPAERSGWSEEKLASARQYSKSIGSAAVMIVQGGRVIDEWGDVDKKLVCYSMRKSLLSALYGIYVNKGVIHLDATLEQMGIDDVPPLTQEERQAKLVDILRARSGVYHLVPFETTQMAKMRPPRGSHKPGTFWYYNNWDFDVLGAIFEKESGLKMGDAFAEQIAGPTGMQDFATQDVFYLPGPESIYPAFHFNVSTRDLARFGLLYLRQGQWKGRQIVPREWVEKSSHTNEMVQANGKDLGGYEYLWWVQYKGVAFPGVDLPPGTYSARGVGGHYLLIIPALDLIIVHRGDNQPASFSIKDVTKTADTGGVSKEQFGPLLNLILSAYKPTKLAMQPGAPR
jgi:CubicO group peptidase (beta-lactamase class C family)